MVTELQMKHIDMVQIVHNIETVKLFSFLEDPMRSREYFVNCYKGHSGLPIAVK